MILRRAIAAAVPLAAAAVLLAGCTGQATPEQPAASPSRDAAAAGPAGSTTPTPTPTPTPTSDAQLPRDSTALARWADLALPENAVGGSRAITRGTGQIGPAGAAVDLPAEAAGLQIVVACQSTDGTPLRLTYGGSGEASEIACSAPGGPPAALTRLPARAGTVHVEADSDAVFVYEVRRPADT